MVLATLVTSRLSTTPTRMELKRRGSMPCSCERATPSVGFHRSVLSQGRQDNVAFVRCADRSSTAAPSRRGATTRSRAFCRCFPQLRCLCCVLGCGLPRSPFAGSRFPRQNLAPRLLGNRALLARARFNPVTGAALGPSRRLLAVDSACRPPAALGGDFPLATGRAPPLLRQTPRSRFSSGLFP